MNKGLVIFTISLLIVVILLLGGILFVGIRGGNVFEEFKMSFSASESEKIIEKEFEIEDFDNVDIDFDAGNVEINESLDNKVKVEIYAEEEYKDKYSVDINDRTLNIIEKKFNEFRFGFNMKERKVIVTLPKGFSNNIKTKTDAGNIKIASDTDFTTEVTIDKNLLQKAINRVNVINKAEKRGVVKIEIKEDVAEEVQNQQELRELLDHTAETAVRRSGGGTPPAPGICPGDPAPRCPGAQ